MSSNNDTRNPQNDVDLLSLQFLMNKSHYSQYLEKVKPDEYSTVKHNNLQFEKFRGKIQHLVNYYMKHKNNDAEYQKEGCIELQDLFNQFILRAITHFQSVEDNKDECETMFDIPYSDHEQSQSFASSPFRKKSNIIDECEYIDDTGDDDVGDDATVDEYTNEYDANVGYSTIHQNKTLDSVKSSNKNSLDIDLLLANRRKYKGIHI
jgi:hypothetical protein